MTKEEKLIKILAEAKKKEKSGEEVIPAVTDNRYDYFVRMLKAAYKFIHPTYIKRTYDSKFGVDLNDKELAGLTKRLEKDDLVKETVQMKNIYRIDEALQKMGKKVVFTEAAEWERALNSEVKFLETGNDALTEFFLIMADLAFNKNYNGEPASPEQMKKWFKEYADDSIEHAIESWKGGSGKTEISKFKNTEDKLTTEPIKTPVVKPKENPFTSKIKKDEGLKDKPVEKTKKEPQK